MNPGLCDRLQKKEKKWDRLDDSFLNLFFPVPGCKAIFTRDRNTFASGEIQETTVTLFEVCKILDEFHMQLQIRLPAVVMICQIERKIKEIDSMEVARLRLSQLMPDS